ncbi:restriction endonuclease subunit S [Aquabacterium sp.]|uniref:restriction endonuclease subunit S n=1 Tax=Aquabacterium sp. TaxID=1872578 RepID=UPI003D003F17
MKWVITRNDGGVWGNDPKGEDDTVVLRSTEQTVDGRWQLDEPALRSLSETEKAGSLLATGDLLVTKSSGSALHIGKTTLVTPEVAALGCCYSNFMQRIRLKPEFDSRLAWYLMNNEIARTQFDLLSNSTTGLANLNGTMLGELVAPIPSPDEQAEIVRFLDRETAKIDALVTEQVQLTTLLKQKRQAVISHAVTKGLDPSVPMKDSGVEWLGEVPVHWEVKQIRQITQILRGKFTHRPRNDPAFYDGDYPFIQTGDVTGAKRYITEFKQTLNDKGAAVSKEFPRGTLVMTIAANIGDVAVLDFPAYFPDSMVGLVPGSNFDLMFLFYLAKSMKQPLEMNATISTQMNLNAEQIGSLSACCPPIDQQRQIVLHLDAETQQLDELIDEAQVTTALLKERRSALISAAVTGQIDVRGLAPEQEQAA